jgi:hypothetical protein
VRRLALLAAAVLTLGTGATGCTDGGADPAPGATGPDGRPGCRGVTMAEVRGPAISYADGPLADVPGSNTLCAAYWLPGADRRFVPQALALDGNTVWVSGYRFDFTDSARRCTLTRVSQRTGRPVASLAAISGAVGERPAKSCRHGGGLALTDEGLWVSETVRLWLLDPDLVGTGRDPVLRVWGIVAPARGSVLVHDRGRLGLGQFVPGGGRGDIDWFDVDDLMAPGVLDLTAGAPAPGQVGPVRRTPGLPWLQGGTMGPHGLYLTQSTTRCGALRLPGGRTVGVAPGTEGIELDDHGDLWAVSESGARTYQTRGGRPLVPMLARYDATRLLRGPRPSCDL